MDSKVLFVVFFSCFVGALSQNLCIGSCPRNEVFSECNAGATCQLTCSTRNSTVGDCGCVSGCICKSGYIRDANTYKCIKISSCPPIESTTCAKNEVYSESGAGCQKNCYTQNRQYKCIPKSGCICKTGYIRSPITNQCILKSSCEKCPSGYYRDAETDRCKLSCDICMDYNAEFKACGDRCRELTCENPLLEGIKCPDDVQCESGCFCKAGYIKDPKTQLCIRPKSCPNPCKDPNAVYSNCGTNNTCDMQTCRFPYGQGEECLKTCAKGCFCKPGYVRNDSGKCVRPRNCPVPNCKRNEIFECRNPTCEAGCIIKPCMSVNCENKCYCKNGYVRENGTCILLEQCKKCEDPNARYSNCKSGCTIATCLNPSGIDPFCQDEICGFGCFCKKGYVADHTGKCILPNKCPICPENESFSCGSAACEKSCGNINDTCDIVNIKCDDKCFCNEGFVRESGPNSTCIPVDTCPIVEPPPPVCADPNAEFNRCASSCQPTCGKPVVGPCNKRCNAICVCKKGFIQNENGKCIKPDKCAKPNCPANEILSCRNPKCVNESCFPSRLDCVDAPCETRCYCAPGFARVNGVCVPKEKCPTDDPPPTECADPNAEYTKCGSKCNQPKCSSVGLTYMCLAVCEVGCFCKKGFFLDSKGMCVAKCTECPANEIMDCRNPTCLNEGCELNGIAVACQNVPCVTKCYCAPGFVRINGVCAPKEKCPIVDPPPTECSDPNAEYTTCGSKCNQPKCSSVGLAFMCLPKCEVGCFCKKGFFLDSKGKCVAKCTECPANESFSCGSAACEKDCSNINDTCDIVNIKCDDKCFCNKGFVRAYRNGPCIELNDCPIEV